MADSASPFYPPRSHWYNPLRYFWFHLGQFMAKLSVATDFIFPALGLSQTLLSLVIPGFVFHALGYRMIGKIALIYVAVASVVFVFWLGYPIATFAYAGILSLHVSSLSLLLKRFVPNLGLVFRMLFTLMILLILTVGVYGTIRHEFEKAFMPLRIGNRVIIVKSCSAKTVRRGDYVAYRIRGNSDYFEHGDRHGTIRTSEGFVLDRVLAQPKDTVRFTKNIFQVNGHNLPLEKYMPTDGEFLVAEKQWFIWPHFAIRGNAPEIEVTKALESYSLISEQQIVGKPLQRWFWRKQILP